MSSPTSPLFLRALVIRGGALGDFLLTLPALSALRSAAPSAHIEALAYPSIASIAESLQLLDRVRPIEYAPLAGFFTRGAALDPALCSYFASFDVVISYLYDPDCFFVENLRSAGVQNFIQGTHLPSSSGHAALQLAAPLANLRIPCPTLPITLPLSPSRSPYPTIAVHPGSGSLSKNWAPQLWELLIKNLLEEFPHNIAIISGEADSVSREALSHLSTSPRIRFWENLPLPQLKDQLAGCQFYLGHDSGISHLAAIAGTPSLLLFGPTDPAVWAPPYRHVLSLRAPGHSLDQLSLHTVLCAIRKSLPAL